MREWTNCEKSRFIFTGKERDVETGYDNFGARLYDGDLGRFLSVDPLAGKYAGWSGYNYVMGNPVRLVDPDGAEPCPPGVDCGEPLSVMEIRRNRGSNLGPGDVRDEGRKYHAGHDLYARSGTSVKAVMEGTIIASGYSSTYGNFLTIEHNEGESKYYSFYAHLSKTNVGVNDEVGVGQIIGKTGITGNAYSGAGGLDEHLHFEFGTELRSDKKFLKKEALLDPNIAYKNVRFDPIKGRRKEQSNSGVIKTILDNEGNALIRVMKFFEKGDGRNKKSDLIMRESDIEF